MFGGYEAREDYEDELYQDREDSSASEVDSELEFKLYSQLHYASCHDNIEVEEEVENEEQDEGQPWLEVRAQPLEGVIVINSDPEIITVSDNTEDEEGICVSKGSTLQRLPRTSRGRPHVHTSSPPAVLNDFSADSDSNSDSDGLESWMVLGQGKHDSDKTIQLNLEGGAIVSSAEDDDDGQSWAISRRDLEAGIDNKSKGPRRMSNRYYTGKSITCRSCNKMGHLSKNCPNPKKPPACTLCGSLSHLQRTCSSRPCTNCNLPGHCYDDCLERAFWHKHCHRCGMTGHFYDACPDIWRQYHLTTQKGPITKLEVEDAYRTPAYCYNCSQKGHFGFECSQRRMFNGTFPTAPYISYYDTPQDLRQRDNRARRKAEELQKAGLLQPSGPEQSTWQPGGDREEGPLRKRMKVKNTAQEKKRKDAPSAKAKKVKKRQQQKLQQEKQQVQPHKPQQHKPQKQRRPKQRQQQQIQQQQPELMPQQQQKKKRWQRKKQMPTEKHKEQQSARAEKQPHSEPRAAQNGRVTRLADEEDFPRGHKRRPSGGPAPPQKVKHIAGLFGPGKNHRKRRPRGRDRKPADRKLENMYPTDENLFTIKQRRKR
ncbi:hypothetical protein COCON_G00112800 [Conger conger]|uniref:Zinc finger CCHC domain-containing protein 7 n=1 Tax=Conger conger TaxID=82655 RepID=A0A9Q1DK85_CONCO|nr:hypothetical protein COCON_G00112800 [Conger conger]